MYLEEGRKRDREEWDKERKGKVGGREEGESGTERGRGEGGCGAAPAAEHVRT